jgi:hypothetical protein
MTVPPIGITLISASVQRPSSPARASNKPRRRRHRHQLRDAEPVEVDDQAEEGLHRAHDDPRDVRAIAPEPPPERHDDGPGHDENEDEAEHVVPVCLAAPADADWSWRLLSWRKWARDRAGGVPEHPFPVLHARGRRRPSVPQPFGQQLGG